jgi:hypothetical protein
MILIISSWIDYHARLVEWCLNESGVDTAIMDTFNGIDIPGITFSISSSRRVNFHLPQGITSVWYRREFQPNSLKIPLNDSRQFILSERSELQRDYIRCLWKSAEHRWIGSPLTTRDSENKLQQLIIAKQCELQIPDTLISNEPRRVRSFARKYPYIIIKPLSQFRWEYPQNTFVTYAQRVEASSILELSDNNIMLCPTIYQNPISKKADIRVVAMGNSLFSFEINQTKSKEIDYRTAWDNNNPDYALKISAIEMPAIEQEKFLMMLRRLNINFASADFVIDHVGKWFFLDLNPSGQWLFLEESVPSSRLAARFCSYLLSGNAMSGFDIFPSLTEFQSSPKHHTVMNELLSDEGTRAFQNIYRGRQHIFGNQKK